ncbi:hypothetical protein NEUTE1DRAFT_18695, partial [Neurospora tetrasperma FGSC 2508]
MEQPTNKTRRQNKGLSRPGQDTGMRKSPCPSPHSSEPFPSICPCRHLGVGRWALCIGFCNRKLVRSIQDEDVPAS